MTFLPHPALPRHSDLPEHQFAEQIRLGNHAAFESLFRTYYSRLCRFAFRMTGSKTSAEELVQDLFVRLWTNRHDLTPEGSLRSYLYRAVRNQSINYLKQKTRNDSSTVEPDDLRSDSNPLEELYSREIRTAIEEAVHLLPPRCRLVFLLHRFDGLTYSEIAEILGISIKTVETQMGRALKTLRGLLAHYLPPLVLLLTLHEAFLP